MWDQECPPPAQDLLLGDGVFTNASPDTTERQAHQDCLFWDLQVLGQGAGEQT